MIKLLFPILLIFLFECTNHNKINFAEYTFEIPEFTEEQNNLIKKIYPIIIQDLPNPANYYIAKINCTKNGIRIIVPRLQLLQNGINHKTGLIKATVDFYGYIYLFKDDLKNYTRTEVVDSDLEELENNREQN